MSVAHCNFPEQFSWTLFLHISSSKNIDLSGLKQPPALVSITLLDASLPPHANIMLENIFPAALSKVPLNRLTVFTYYQILYLDSRVCHL